MIDLHNHILYGADDGAQTLEDSLTLLKAARQAGFNGAVLTPHFMISRGFTKTSEENRATFDTIVSAMQGIDPTFKLYFGSELFYDYRLVDLIGTNAYTTMGDSGYYLIETGRQGGTALGIQNFMLKLRQAGGKTIFAHPERYDFVQEDPNILLEFMAKGTLIQANYLSLTGYYGKVTQDTIRIMLQNNMVQLMGSDAHQAEAYELYPEAKAAGEAIIGVEKWHELTEINSHKLMEKTGTIDVDPKWYKKALSKTVIARYAL